MRLSRYSSGYHGVVTRTNGENRRQEGPLVGLQRNWYLEIDRSSVEIKESARAQAEASKDWRKDDVKQSTAESRANSKTSFYSASSMTSIALTSA